MLTQVKAFSSWRSAPVLPLGAGGRAETDLIQIRNIDGLDPVKASVNTTQYGSVDGASYSGSSVPSRNIVLSLHPNPDWDNYTYESLRKLIYAYFMPKLRTRLDFYSDDLPTVTIEGIVEDVRVNAFSKDPEIIVSIICPEPYFVALVPTVVNGITVRPGGAATVVTYDGNIESGIVAKVTWTANPLPSTVEVRIGETSILVATEINPNLYFEMSSIPMRKYVQAVNLTSGLITNLLSSSTIAEGSAWPILVPGDNDFRVITDTGNQDFELTYFERFGGL